MKDLIIEVLNFFRLAFWVEIVTETPKCTYYFGPFLSLKEAESASLGYLEDLSNENAQGVSKTIKRMKPGKLTIFDEVEDNTQKIKVSKLSSQTL